MPRSHKLGILGRCAYFPSLFLPPCVLSRGLAFSLLNRWAHRRSEFCPYLRLVTLPYIHSLEFEAVGRFYRILHLIILVVVSPTVGWVDVELGDHQW